MSGEYLAFDFETANAERSSACAIGLALVREGEIIEAFSRLIRPQQLYFDPYNIAIHGITAEDVKNEPEFDRIWEELKPRFEGQVVVAHSAGFDMSVLRHVLDEYGVPYPELTYYCTRLLSKCLWPGLVNYSLATVTEHLGIEFEHHDPSEDARACAEICRQGCHLHGVTHLDDLAPKMNIREGRLFADSYKRPLLRRSYSKLKLSEIEASTDEFDESHPFFEKIIVFTGTLQSMTRREAAQRAVDAGAKCVSAVSKKTGFLVLGDQDFYKLKGGTKSSKMKKAQELIAGGHDLEILPEDEFLRMLAE